MPLDPATWTALQRCLDHHAQLVGPLLSHILDPAGVRPKLLRSTRLAKLVNTLDPKLVSPRSECVPRASPSTSPTASTKAGWNGEPVHLSRYLAHVRANMCALDGWMLLATPE